MLTRLPSLRRSLFILLVGVGGLIALTPARAGVLTGLYFMTRYSTFTHDLEKSLWYFSADGRFYEGLQGLTAKDIAAHQGVKGRFRVSGNTLELRYDNGGKPMALAMESYADGGFGYNMGIYSPVRPYTNARQLVGSYSGGQHLFAGGNTLLSSSSLTLYPNGTYTDGTVTSNTNANDNTGAYDTNSRNRGRWQWAGGYYLTMTGSNGQSIQMVAFPISKDLAFIGGMLYSRK